MPEIAEIARVVHFLTIHLVGKKIKKATAIDDSNVFGKVGTTGSEVAAALTGKKVVSAGRQGKYFWLVLDSPPHPVMHFGMTGWIHIKDERTAYTNYYKKMKADEMDLWPPKFWKFQLETEGDPSVEVAFADPRRFGRVRLVNCPGENIRKFSPLVENGPDPVVDQDVFTEDYLKSKMRSRHVPVKALILDQAMISGIGNWVGDEVLYHAKLHPEQYCDDFGDEQIHALYESIRYVCGLAVEKLGDSDQFPEHWLFNHRWGKGTKGASSQLPNGEKLAFLTVGGRTSCYAPAVQKKTGRTAPGIEEEPLESGGEEAVAAGPKKKMAKSKKLKSEAAPTSDQDEPPAKTKGPRSRAKPVKAEDPEEEKEEEKPPQKRKRGEEPSEAKKEAPLDKKRGQRKAADKVKGSSEQQGPSKAEAHENSAAPSAGRRRSGRLQGKSG